VRSRGHRLAWAVLAFGLFAAVPARADNDEARAGARAAATLGINAFEQGKWQESIDYMAKAEAVFHAPTHLLYMARSYEKLGNLVRARELYIKLQSEKLADDAPAVFVQARADARQALEQLEPRLAHVTIKLAGVVHEKVVVKEDDIAIPVALVGVPRPVNPGRHVYRAYAEGVESPAISVSIQEGEDETVSLKLPEAPAGTKAATDKPQDVTTDAGAHDDRSSPLFIPGIVSAGVGVVALGFGTMQALRAKGKYADADDACDPNSEGACQGDREDVEQLEGEGDDAKRMAQIGFAVGGLGVAAGATLLILSWKADSKSSTAASGSRAETGSHERDSLTLVPWVGWASLGVNGSF